MAAKSALDLIKSGLEVYFVKQKKGWEIADVDSSAIESVAYDEKSSMMRITFNNGGVYQYFGVSPEQFEDLIAAGSVGRTFVREVRNDYLFVRIG